jgi:hypothetical protein
MATTLKMSMATTLNAVPVTVSVAGKLRACGRPGGQAMISQRGRSKMAGHAEPAQQCPQVRAAGQTR